MKRPLLVLFWSALIVPAFLAALLGWLSYRQTLEQAAFDAKRMAEILREHALRVLETQQTTIAWIDRYLAGMSWEEIAQSDSLHGFLRQLAERSEHIDAVWLTAPDGTVVNGTFAFPMPALNVFDRDYFQLLINDDTTYLGEIAYGRLTNRKSLNLARRRSAPDGRFDGTILVTIALPYFEQFWESALQGRVGVAGIVRDNGQVLARFPSVAEASMTINGDSPFFHLTQSHDVGAYEYKSGLDGRVRIYGFAKLGEFPAYVTIGLDRHAVLAAWRGQILVLTLLAVMASSMLVVVVRIAQQREAQLTRESARRQQAETSLVAKEEHVAALERAEERLRESEARLREAQEIAQLGRWEYDFATHTLHWSEEVFRIFGRPLDSGVPSFAEMRELMHPDDRPAYDAGMRDFRIVTAPVERRYRRPDGSYRWVRSQRRAFLGPDGRATRIVGTLLDITDRKEAESRQRLLMAELDHRVKNILATVQAVVARSLGRRAGAEALGGRIAALARAHTLLGQNRWRGASLLTLLQEELVPYQGGPDGARVVLDGPDILLSPKGAQSLGLVLHELATNAAKYGALSIPEGHLHVRWQILAQVPPRLQLDWRETDGPAATAPQHRGFGLRLIERSLEYDLGGTAQLSFVSEGLHARLELPLDPAIASIANTDAFAAPQGDLQPVPAAPADGQTLAGLGVLVVEDEALVALDVAAVLRGAGCAVVGPVGRLDAALKLAQEERLDAAVLDVNLGGPMVFPVAEALRARGVPFIFLTGYDEGFLPPALRNERRVAKPLQPADLIAALAQAVALSTRAKAS